ncbi:hypothetical protein PV773_24265 [Mesorhizobium sp. CC13]|uniref:alpha/beta fold hydrolase n=1 Tax=Mesorhizobium sp. CC13 TaxID=3029194 RepID=UPI003266A14E
MIGLPIRLVVAGAAQVIGESDIAEIEALAPKIEVRIVKDAGHMIPWDNLEGFVNAVADFRA